MKSLVDLLKIRNYVQIRGNHESCLDFISHVPKVTLISDSPPTTLALEIERKHATEFKCLPLNLKECIRRFSSLYQDGVECLGFLPVDLGDIGDNDIINLLFLFFPYFKRYCIIRIPSSNDTLENKLRTNYSLSLEIFTLDFTQNKELTHPGKFLILQKKVTSMFLLSTDIVVYSSASVEICLNYLTPTTERLVLLLPSKDLNEFNLQRQSLDERVTLLVCDDFSDIIPLLKRVRNKLLIIDKPLDNSIVKQLTPMFENVCVRNNLLANWSPYYEKQEAMYDNLYLLSSSRKIKYLCLVTSALIRNKYTVEQTLTQIFEGVTSLRKRLPDCHIVFLERSVVEDSIKNTLRSFVDELRVESGREEETIIDFLSKNRISYEYLVKIDSRFILNDFFDLSKWSHENKACFFSSDNCRVCTTFYTVSKGIENLYSNSLKECLRDIEIDTKHMLLFHLGRSNVNLVTYPVGTHGYNAINENYETL